MRKSISRRNAFKLTACGAFGVLGGSTAVAAVQDDDKSKKSGKKMLEAEIRLKEPKKALAIVTVAVTVINNLSRAIANATLTLHDRKTHEMRPASFGRIPSKSQRTKNVSMESKPDEVFVYVEDDQGGWGSKDIQADSPFDSFTLTVFDV